MSAGSAREGTAVNIITKALAEVTQQPTTIALYRSGPQYVVWDTMAEATAHAEQESIDFPHAWIGVLGAEVVAFGGFGARHRRYLDMWHDGRNNWK